MNCGCGSTYTLTPGDRLYLSAMVKSLQRRVSVLEENTISVPQWALQPSPPVYNVNQIIGAVASSDLADVAFSGDFNDLLNVPPPPVIPVQVNADWNATSGVEQILNKPVLGELALEDDADADGVEYARKNNTWVPVTHPAIPPIPSQVLAFNEQVGTTYTLALGDAFEKCVRISNAGDITLTIPTNAAVAFDVGTIITIMQGGAGKITIAPASGVTVENPFGDETTDVGDFRVLIKRGTDTWVIG